MFFCQPQSKLDLLTLRRVSRERKNATEQIKNMTLARIWTQILRYIAPTLYQLSYGDSWQNLRLILISFANHQITPPLSFFRVDFLNDIFLFIDSICFFYGFPQYSILFGYLYAVIRINVVECFFAFFLSLLPWRSVGRSNFDLGYQKNTQQHWF